jgi:CelD/BcsL family acetyltransferase involved in cellulose biosynthesis
VPADSGHARRTTDSPLVVERRPVADIAESEWQRLAAANPWATPFSSHAFHRAWWDAYGSNAIDETLVVRPAGGPRPQDGQEPLLAILPLMRRHEQEPGDAESHTLLRHGHEPGLTPVANSAVALFLGASYHADYATLLAAPADMPAACEAIVDHLAAARAPRRDDAGAGATANAPTWDVIDFRRLRCGDPTADELAVAFGRREMELGWTLTLEREDVCPAATIPDGADFDGFLATLRGKDRHEIRRKLRRAESAGAIGFEVSKDPLADLNAFIDLHQARWGNEGLFPPTPGGDQSRRFLRRLFELSGSTGDVGLTFLTVGGRRIASGIHFQTPDAVLYYTAGVDPDALDLSPGVLLVAAYVRLAIETGRHRLDFLRGDEPYKYQWGAIDQPIRRLLVRPTAMAAS